MNININVLTASDRSGSYINNIDGNTWSYLCWMFLGWSERSTVGNFLVIFFLIILVMGLIYSWRFANSQYRTAWYRPDPCSRGDRLSWDDICRILDNEPIKHEKRLRIPDASKIITDSLFILLWIMLWFIITTIFYNIETNEGELNFSGNELVVGIVMAIVASFTLYAQIRAKVQSENRQRWINDVRSTLAEVINGIPRVRNRSKLTRMAKKLSSPSTENHARMKLELLLNPSEKDHRTLNTLLRKAYGIKLIAIDGEVINNCSKIGRIDPTVPSDRKKLITWILRLSNALLKREWERVKSGK